MEIFIWATKLKFVIPLLSHVSNLECEASHLGKHHFSSFLSVSYSHQFESFDVVCILH